MRSLPPLEFPHRINENGSTSSICPRCYVTVATSTWEADLEHAEHHHKCERTRLRSFAMTHKPPFRETWVPSKRLDRIA